jgi:hypothetical protein
LLEYENLPYKKETANFNFGSKKEKRKDRAFVFTQRPDSSA